MRSSRTAMGSFKKICPSKWTWQDPESNTDIGIIECLHMPWLSPMRTVDFPAFTYRDWSVNT
jgi:hypothetical protein